MTVEKINKFIEKLPEKLRIFIIRGLYALGALLGIGAVAANYGCAEEIAHAAPTDTIPAATQMIKPTNTINYTPSPTPTSTPAPSFTPTIIPELSYEEESKLVGYNPSISKFMAAAIAGVYYEGEMIDDKGNIQNVKRIAFVYLRDIPQTDDFGIHIMFNDTMILKVKDHPSSYFTSDIPRMTIETIDETLKNINVIETFDIHELKQFCQKHNIPFKDNEAFSKITNYIEKNGLQLYIEAPFEMATKDFLQIYLSLPKEYRIPLSETIINDNSISYETPVPSIYNPTASRSFTSKDGVANLSYKFNTPTSQNVVDANVTNGYRNKDYYDNRNQYTVDAIKRSVSSVKRI